MNSKKLPEKPAVVLPVGYSIAPDREQEILAKQEFINSGAGVSKKPDKIWYVLTVERHQRTNFEFSLGDFVPTWHWAYTKSWARQIARREQAKGHEVIDIFQGTKSNILNKYKGL